MAGTLHRVFIGDGHGNFQGFDIARRIADERGIARRTSLGDLTHELSASETKDAALRAEQFRAQLLPAIGHDGKLTGSSLRKNIQKGLYSDETLAMFSQPRGAGLESLLNHGRHTYQLLYDIDPTLEYVPGNWDVEEPMLEVLGEKVHHNEFAAEDGMTVLYAGGGGAPHTKAGVFSQGFFSDYPDKGISHSHDLGKLLLKPRAETQEGNEIDMIVTHIPPPIEGQHVDNYAQHFQEYLLQRNSLGLPTPKLIVNGHHHLSDAEVEFKTYMDKVSGKSVKILTFTPGILALEYNDSSHGAFCVAHFDEGTKQLVKVDEYHIHKTIDGTMKVNLHGEHDIDHESEKVTFTAINRPVLAEPWKEMFQKSTALDRNYALEGTSFNLQYEGLNGKALDQAIKHNLAVSGRYGEQARDIVKAALDTVKERWLEGKSLEDTFTDSDVLKVQHEVADLLAREAAKIFSINIDELGFSGFDLGFYKNRLIRIMFGVNRDLYGQAAEHIADLQEATKIDGKKYQDIPSDWGKELLVKAARTISGQGQSYFLPGIKPEMWTAMVDEVYKPLSMERTRSLTLEEAKGLYISGINNGILTEEELQATGAYRKVPGFKANTKTDEQIDEMFGISYTVDDELPEQLPDLSVDKAEEIQRGIDSGAMPIFRNNKGDYLLTQSGNQYLSPELAANLNYQPVRISDLFHENRAKLVAKDDAYFVNQGRNLFPINLELEGINPDEYTVLRPWQLPLEQQKEQRRAMEEFQQRLAGNNLDLDVPLNLPTARPSWENTGLPGPTIPLPNLNQGNRGY